MTETDEQIENLEERIEVLETALNRIYNWSIAYPLDIFPKPDMKKAREVLRNSGMTIDSITGEVARHIVSGIGKIAGDALNSTYQIERKNIKKITPPHPAA